MQTLFYGVFSAWVIAARKGGVAFDWKTTAHILTVPMIRSLFEEMAKPSRLQPLGLTPLLDRTGEALSRVNTAEFFKSFDTGLAVQHFYEPFLQHFDPELRKELGVWYTPPEIVRYMVERIDRTLRSELGIAEGLANENVYVLDPCCGTGAYLVEVLRRIERTHKENGADALMGEDIKEAARKRIFGFELLPASFVVAHWQIGNLLADIKAPLDTAKNERPAIYLTNALTGWEPPKGPKETIGLFPELEDERDAAEHVKREAPILVVLGNPPYNAYAGTSPEEERGLVEPYKEGLIKKWDIKKFNLDELYVRFFRIAERRIAKGGRGIVSYISNYSYVSEPSFVVMRQHLLQNFNKIWIENMHGDRNKSEYAPDGRTSETVFAIRGFSPGIRQGVVVSLAVKTGKAGQKSQVFYRDDLHEAKADARRKQLLDSLDDANAAAHYAQADPQPHNRYSFRPMVVSEDYLTWPLIREIGARYYNGPTEYRGMSLIRYPDQRKQMLDAITAYLDPGVTDEAAKIIEARFMASSGEFNAENVRKALCGKVQASDSRIVPYPFKPFDMRVAYLDNDIAPLFSRPAPDLLAHRTPQNWFLISRDTADKVPEGPPFFASRLAADRDCISGHARHFPVLTQEKTKKAEGQHAMDFGAASAWKANLSKPAQDYLKALKCPPPDKDFAVAELPWLHALAIGFAPEYLMENADGIANNWPRIPLPDSKKQLEASAALGRKLVALLDTDTPLDPQDYHKVLGVISAADLSVTAGWGWLDKAGKVYPGTGKVVKRAYTKEELQALGGREAQLGATLDLYLNDSTYWRCVPEAVWEYYIGGYQPVKKWLSYREQPILGRPLTKEEARYITGIIRRLASIVLLGEELNQNYIACRDDSYVWPQELEKKYG